MEHQTILLPTQGLGRAPGPKLGPHCGKKRIFPDISDGGKCVIHFCLPAHTSGISQNYAMHPQDPKNRVFGPHLPVVGDQSGQTQKIVKFRAISHHFGFE